MIRTILLLNPVYVTLFWAILLNISERNASPARIFLGKFMIFAFIVYLSHFVFYFPFKGLYPYIDPLYQFSSLSVYPLYYIYLRLLTVDEKFSLTKHLKFLILPAILVLIYISEVAFCDFEAFKIWIYEKDVSLESPGLKYLKITYMMMRFLFIVQVILLMIESSRLLKQYAAKAEQYYSDIEDGKNRNVKILNISMILIGIFSVVIASLGRDFFQHELTMIGIISVLFSSLLFIVGYMGYKQKPVNHSSSVLCPESEIKTPDNQTQIDLSNNILIEKIIHLFEKQKIFLNESLTIVDLANITGTNRTYISHIINHHYHQNFCTFVNNFRVEEVKRIIVKDPSATNQILAEKCGFSSADSLKRVIKNMTGMSVTELKSHILKK
ncbi:MAG: helix-turn-helix domain-containing protein [Paludibacter sp.]|nr:helix-turn-helix domain-containing protein [Paludibacter sp.]